MYHDVHNIPSYPIVNRPLRSSTAHLMLGMKMIQKSLVASTLLVAHKAREVPVHGFSCTAFPIVETSCPVNCICLVGKVLGYHYNISEHK